MHVHAERRATTRRLRVVRRVFFPLRGHWSRNRSALLSLRLSGKTASRGASTIKSSGKRLWMSVRSYWSTRCLSLFAAAHRRNCRELVDGWNWTSEQEGAVQQRTTIPDSHKLRFPKPAALPSKRKCKIGRSWTVVSLHQGTAGTRMRTQPDTDSNSGSSLLRRMLRAERMALAVATSDT